MPKYLLKVNYVGEGVAGLLAEGGTSRRRQAEELAASTGGRIESLYSAFGDTDLYVVAEFPDAASVTAVSLALNASGRMKATVTPLLTPGDVDAATKKQPRYRAPGS